MTRCVVRSLRGVDVPSFPVGSDTIEELVQILAGRGIGVLVDDEARTGVADKHRDNAFAQTGSRDEARDLVGDFITTAPAGADFETFCLGDHWSELSTLIPQLSTP